MKSNRNVNAIAIATLLAAGMLLILPGSNGLATVDGVYHRVQKGETVWQISRAYRLDIETIKKANHIPRSMKIKAGQYLFIPGAEKAIKIEPQDRLIKHVLYWARRRPRKWKYVVIHHSATDKGNAYVFDKHHKKRGFKYGLGYHFVICNGTYRRKDGQIEIGNRWKWQLDGAHCRAGNGNQTGIGVCLVGDFNKTKPTQKQFDSLVRLVTHLCYHYEIPLKNVKGHGQMAGANTECPGKNFPWDKFRKALQQRGCK